MYEKISQIILFWQSPQNWNRIEFPNTANTTKVNMLIFPVSYWVERRATIMRGAMSLNLKVTSWSEKRNLIYLVLNIASCASLIAVSYFIF